MHNVHPTSLARNVCFTASTPATPRVNDTVSRDAFTLPPALQIVRDVVLPRTNDTLPQVIAIEACYRRLTGRPLPTYEAIRLLDQIKAERAPADPCDPRPIPAELTPIADWMVRAQYDRDSVYLAIREIERTGTAVGSPSLDGEDVELVEAMIPAGFVGMRGRASGGTWYEAFA